MALEILNDGFYPAGDVLRLVKYIPEENETEIVIPEGVYDIDDSVFENCENIVSVKLPSSLVHIYDMAFRNCKNLREIEFPENLHIILDSAFEGCVNLRKITFNNPDTRIDPHNFEDCVNLKEIHIKSFDMYDRLLQRVTDITKIDVYLNGELMPKEVPEVEADWDKVADTYRKNRDSWLEKIKNKK